MMKSFKHKGLRAFFEKGDPSGIHPDHAARLSPLALSVTEAAQALQTTRKHLSALLNGRSGISPLMAKAQYGF